MLLMGQGSNRTDLEHSLCETLAQQFFYPVSDAPSFSKTDGYGWGLGWTFASLIFASTVLPWAVKHLGAPRRQRG